MYILYKTLCKFDWTRSRINISISSQTLAKEHN